MATGASTAQNSVPERGSLRYLPPFALLRAFEAVGRHGGIRRAAQILSMDHTTVSRHLRSLEQWCGVQLVERAAGTSGFLTEEGRAYHARISVALAEISAASKDLRSRDEVTDLSVWCVAGFASQWLAGHLRDFSARFPDIDLELHVSNDQPNFATHQADVRIFYQADFRAPPEPNPLIRNRELLRPQVLPVASPEFMRRHKSPETLEELSRMPLLHENGIIQWQCWFEQQGVGFTDMDGLKLGQGQLTIAAAQQSQGVALANRVLIQEPLQTGALVVVGNWPPVYLGSYMFEARADRWSVPSIARFRSWLETNLTR